MKNNIVNSTLKSEVGKKLTKRQKLMRIPCQIYNCFIFVNINKLFFFFSEHYPTHLPEAKCYREIGQSGKSLQLMVTIFFLLFVTLYPLCSTSESFRNYHLPPTTKPRMSNFHNSLLLMLTPCLFLNL